MAYQFKPFEKTVGTFVVLTVVVLLLATIYIARNRHGLFQTYGTYFCYYKDGNDVATGQKIIYNGIAIGKTTDLEFQSDDRVKVTFKVKSEFTNRVKADSIAHLKPSIMGGASIVISKGSPTAGPHPTGVMIWSSDDPEGRQLFKEVGGKVINPSTPDRIVDMLMALLDVFTKEDGPVLKPVGKLMAVITDLLDQKIDPRSEFGRMLVSIRKLLEDSSSMLGSIKGGDMQMTDLLMDKAMIGKLQGLLRSTDDLLKNTTVLTRNLSTMPLLNGANTRNPVSATIDANERVDGYRSSNAAPAASNR
ncbi:MAG: MCE family protein [Spirochaetes bacterium]|nr:MCE family protein [Spirochaetota bacterium]